MKKPQPPSVKKIEKFLREIFGKDNHGHERVTGTNRSGAPFIKTSISDYYIAGVGWVEIKRGDERMTKEQYEFLRCVGGFAIWFLPHAIDIVGPFDPEASFDGKKSLSLIDAVPLSQGEWIGVFPTTDLGKDEMRNYLEIHSVCR